ncbi:MAG: hypothetical protein LBJ98_03425 [Endomicrobium sp.]|jgi:hypothetical protein|nr:hypothetical protein [Endomicrobium sp.]
MKLVVYFAFWIALVLGFISGGVGGLQLAFFSLVVLFIWGSRGSIIEIDIVVENIQLLQTEVQILKERVEELELDLERIKKGDLN